MVAFDGAEFLPLHEITPSNKKKQNNHGMMLGRYFMFKSFLMPFLYSIIKNRSCIGVQ